ncbi:SLAIN motif-containing protein 1 isoform X1 [Sinocyclocheilus grahami]|uniref:SLAIN motif-containing protein 1 isoform X1 n=1 Tax=Sinocyclocheilus grahami TaxID=75366 RepID=UPI0007ACB5CF|nr:PREDICTED: SLAIN motif-containing protein 1-like isoform X1 [Sinocyclocheilus grahami]
MEAAVLERRMMADARAELQVQKLQELVRRLERQNEQLRSSRCIPPDPFPCFQPHSAAEDEDEDEDELTLLDLQSASGESDETWLYESPSSHLRSGAGLDALQWTRHVLDQLDAARHSLGQRLESVSRWRSGFSSPAFPRARVVGVSPLCTSSPSYKPCAPLPSSTSCERAGRSVSVDSDVSASEPDTAAVSLGYKLQDLTDVQVMARLQEESLRQDYASTSSSSSMSLRSSSFSFQFGQHSDSHLDEEEEEEDEDYGQLPPPQPCLSRARPLQRSLPHSHTFSSIRDWTQTQTQTHCRDTQPGLSSSSDKLRRSMPDLLVCAALSPALSSGSMRSSQSFDSSGALTRLQSCIPAPAQLQSRVQSVGSFSSRQPLKATAYVSPTVKGSSLMSSSVSLQSLSVSGVPKAAAASRSGLPRPSSFISTGSGPRAKLTAPLRSLLPPPKSLATLSALRDGSWRDGCY